MKLFGSNPWRRYCISRVLREAVFFSSKAHPRKDSLYQKIRSGHRDPNIPITPVLDQWLQQGHNFTEFELLGLIKELRKFRRYSHALQIKEWMTEKMNFEHNDDGIAGKLDLICKVHGLDKAEEYFNSIPIPSRVDKIYGAMLNCYCEKKSLEKAENIFKKMTGLGVASSFTYNVMLILYSRGRRHKKFNKLVQEMEDKGVKFDTHTYNIQLNTYADSKVEEMEKLLSKMEGDSQVKLDAHVYFIASKGYLKHGLSKKALNVLRKAEKLIESTGNHTDYEHLLTLYSTAGRKEEVHRIWDVYKRKVRVSNSGYLSVISSLLKLEDIGGAEKVLETWECEPTSFDLRFVNMFISSYCKKGLLDKAFACAERFTDKGHILDAGIWQCLATRCCVDRKMEKAVETVKKVILAGGPKWKLKQSTLSDCLAYLKKEGNVDAAHEIVGLIRETGSYSDDVCDRLIDFVKGDQDCGSLAGIGI